MRPYIRRRTIWNIFEDSIRNPRTLRRLRRSARRTIRQRAKAALRNS